MHIDVSFVCKEASSSVQALQGVLGSLANIFMSAQSIDSGRPDDGRLLFKVSFFLSKLQSGSKSEGKHSKEEEIFTSKVASLGQFTEYLSSTVGLSRSKSCSDLATEHKCAIESPCTDREQGAFDFLRLAFPLDGWNPFQKCETRHPPGFSRREQHCCHAATAVPNAGRNLGFSLEAFSNFVLPSWPKLAVEEPRDDRSPSKAPIQKHFFGFLVHVPESNPHHTFEHEAGPDPKKLLANVVFLSVLLQDLFSFTKVFSIKKAGVFGFARVQGEPSIVEPAPFEEGNDNQTMDLSPRPGIPRFNLPNIEKLRSSPLASSLAEFMEFVPHLGKTSQDYPDKRKLFSVQDFFKYTEAEGKKLFDELDRDKDGQVSLEDLELAMKKRRLPQRYAREFLRRTKKHWLKKSFGWNEFLSLMEQKEPMILRAFNSLSLSKSGTLQKGQVLTLLRNAGLPSTEENAAAMMRFLDSDTEGSITYGQFRNFLVLLPPERLFDDPRMVWFEAATVVPMAPPVEIPAGSVLKSALAGGLACALSTSLLHPLDTIKTRVQASTLSFPELMSNIPSIGIRGLYRGSAPAIVGQFSSHGLRTGIFEASKLLLFNMAPSISELQVQSLASFCSTFLGTALRIPCEVLKQRLQAGLYENVGDAIVGTLHKDGWKGFFRGTGATLCREVPFYVAGMMIYEEAKKVVQNVLKRDLAPWEFIAIGGLSGGLAAVCTTPFDVMKTRMMTAAPGVPITMSTVAVRIVNEEGLLALFKGAVPRFFWIAPLGAMNFAGYELAKRAMEKKG